MRVRQACTFDTVTCARETSALQVARLMRDRHVGAVVVVDAAHEGDVPVGVVTDRDLAIRVLALGMDPSSLCAADVMADRCVTVLDTDLAYEAIWEMRRASVRRLPVVDAKGCLVGIIAMDDLTRFLAQELGDTAAIAQHQLAVERERLSR